MEHDTSAHRWLGAAEALAVLAGCMGLIVVVGAILVALLAPRLHDLRVELEGRPGAVSVDLAELERRVAALGLPGTVSVRERRGVTTLVLAGLPAREGVIDPVHRVLARSGYASRQARFRTRPDVQALVLEHAKLFFGIQSAILVLVGGLFIVLRVRRDAAAAALPWSLLFGVAAGAVGFVCSATIGLVQQLLGLEVQEQAWLLALLKDRDSLIGLIPWIVVLVPLAEEVFFRGYFFRFLYQRVGSTVAYLLSAACFSAIHFHLPGLLVYFVVGLIFAWVCRRTATLVAPVVAHMTYNGCALTLALVALGS